MISGNLDIIDSQIKNNKVTGYGGLGSIVEGNVAGYSNIKNSNITNNQASESIVLNANLEKTLLNNNKARDIVDFLCGYILKTTFQNNVASESIVGSISGQYSGLSKISYSNFIGNKGYLLTGYNGYQIINLENNYWGSSNPNWSKILKNIKKPTKYYKYKI